MADKPQIMPLFLRVGANNTEPMLEIRLQVTNLELIKALISAAYRNQPLSFMPQFRDTIKALSSLQDKGLVYLHKEEGIEEYRFTF